ncbi:MAG: saccharopine dehydrogenase C-terminal domain-containing protein [Vicinamibacterales bacterium]
MKILVFGGSGKMGKAVAFDLAKEPAVTQIGLVGRRQDALDAASRWLHSPKVVTHAIDVEETADVKALMKQYDVVACTLPDRRTSYLLMQAAVESGTHMVDMLEEYHRRPDAYETEGLILPAGMTLNEYGDYLHETAVENDVCVMDGIGFAPGLSNITTGEGIRKLDVAESAIARVGGIPSKEAAAKHPLRYMITWAFWHVLREYMIRVNVIKDGKVVEIDAATDREKFVFDKFGVNETLECAVTPGMPSFIFTRPGLKEFAEKTVRWPSHWDSVETLKECGLLDAEAVDFRCQKIVPRDFLLSRIEPRLRANPGETDVCVMYCTVIGTKYGMKTKVSYYLWDTADTVNGITSMGRVTGFSAAIGAVMIGKGLIKERGLVPPEDCIYGPLYHQFIAELEKRNIRVLETVETIA